MNHDLKLRLYLTVIVIAMGFLYIAPLYIASNTVSPFLVYLLPFIPAISLLWFNWFLKPDFVLTEESYPRRTIIGLLWLGLLVAVIGVWLPLYGVASSESADLQNILSTTFWRGPWLASAWLIPPLLFHHLVGPASLSARMRIGKVVLCILAATPIASLALYAVREA